MIQNLVGLCLVCLIKLGHSFGRDAINIINDAEARGLIQPGGTIVEATSGNTGMGLALVAAPPARADVLEVPPATTKMGGLLEKYADVNRGFRLLKPTTWNQFDGEPGAYDVRWVDVVAPAESVTLSTSTYGAGQSIEDLAAVDKLGAKLANARGTLTGARARRSDSILFYDYSFARVAITTTTRATATNVASTRDYDNLLVRLRQRRLLLLQLYTASTTKATTTYCRRPTTTTTATTTATSTTTTTTATTSYNNNDDDDDYCYDYYYDDYYYYCYYYYY